MKKTAICFLGWIIMIFNAFADEKRTFSVTADAIVRASPDRVVLNIGAETRGDKLNTVRDTNFDIIKKTIEILKRNGIDDKNIGTNYVNIDTRYPERDDYAIITFIVEQSISVTVTDISKYDKILTDVIDAGINRIHGIEFQTSNLKKYRYEARSLAIAAAKERAEFLAREAGFRLGNVVNLDERTNDYYWRPGSDRGGMGQMVTQRDDGNTRGDSDTLAPGMISIRSNVTLYYNVK